HAQIQIVLISINTDHRRPRYDHNFTFNTGGLGAEVIGRGFDNQPRFAVFKLWRRLGARDEVPRSIGNTALPKKTPRGSRRFPDWIPGAILLHVGRDFSHA